MAVFVCRPPMLGLLGWLTLVSIGAGPIGCAAGDGDPGDEGSDGGSDAAGAGTGALGMGGGGPSSSSSSVGSGQTGGGSQTTGAGAGGSEGPFGTYAPGDDPPFKTGAELCAYVNEERAGYAPHDRWRGPPWNGEYHQNVTWPLALTIDAALSSEAQAQAAALAGGGSPEGAPYSDGSPPPHQYLYVSGVNTASYMIASEEKAGDWTTDLAGNLVAGITSNNGTARMGMFYQDSGGSGPALTRIGCGGAATLAGGRWWVMLMAP